MSRLVNCAFCSEKVQKSQATRLNSKNYHKECAEQWQDREALMNYVCELFDFVSPGPKIYAQIKKFTQTMGLSYRGIHFTLRYFFEVNENPIEKANGGIGIVPYVYDEAGLYFQKEEAKRQGIVRMIQNQGLVKPVEIVIKKREDRDNRRLYDLDDFVGGEDD